MTRDIFNDIIHNLNRKLFSIAFRIIKNQQEAEDAVQEVFMKMWMMKDKLDDYKDIEALAVTITRNDCIDRLRKWKHFDNEKDGSELLNYDPSPSPYDQLVNSENVEILNGIIENLPPVYRDLIRLREINGLSYEEIALQNTMNINTIRVTLSRARRIIKEKYLKFIYERGKTETTTRKVL